MVENFEYFTENVSIPVSIGSDVNFFEGLSKEDFFRFYSGGKKSLRWTYNGKIVIIEDPDASIIGYPSLDMEYVIAIYTEEISRNYSPPKNAVVYREDGSLHKQLTIPHFQSKVVLDRLKINNDENPPLGKKYPGILFFDHVSWQKLENDIVVAIRIIYDQEWYETVEINPATAKFGKCLDSGRL